ncbi:hypothetical protein OE88DRAFT_1214041 [Heliocybe sulcata]|uniref:Uncharacterized protein n=1 Tax=Heliocybe sulcata TaxID=5364 RepID=A0A5C3MJE8_9AGAM|nr:hypothetical protein OE88DRAFT_1214041 [Heliocybe sulcata]
MPSCTIGPVYSPPHNPIVFPSSWIERKIPSPKKPGRREESRVHLAVEESLRWVDADLGETLRDMINTYPTHVKNRMRKGSSESRRALQLVGRQGVESRVIARAISWRKPVQFPRPCTSAAQQRRLEQTCHTIFRRETSYQPNDLRVRREEDMRVQVQGEPSRARLRPVRGIPYTDEEDT